MRSEMCTFLLPTADAPSADTQLRATSATVPRAAFHLPECHVPQTVVLQPHFLLAIHCVNRLNFPALLCFTYTFPVSWISLTRGAQELTESWTQSFSPRKEGGAGIPGMVPTLMGPLGKVRGNFGSA